MRPIRLLLPLLLLPSAAFSSEPKREPTRPEVEIGFRGEAWFADLDGDVQVQAAGFTGTRLTYEGLGMDTTETLPVGEAYLRFGTTNGIRHRLSARYWENTFSGKTTLTQAVTFKTLTFGVSTDVSSRLAIRELDLRYRYEFWQAEPARAIGDHPSAFWGTFALKGLDLESELSATAVGTAREDATGVLPALGLGGRLALGKRFSLEAEAVGAKAGTSGLDVSFYEASALARWDLGAYAALEAGWRRWSLDFDVDSTTDVDGEAVLQGAFVGLELRF